MILEKDRIAVLFLHFAEVCYTIKTNRKSMKGVTIMGNERIIAPGEIYRHFKNRLYQIIAIAYHSETGEKYVVYQAMYDDFKIYIRPYDMFISKVDKDKYPLATAVYRFEKVDREELTGLRSVNDVPGKQPEEVQADNNDDGDKVNPYLMGFFDCDTSASQIEYLNSIRGKIDDRLINDIAVSLDLTVDDGNIDDRIDSLIRCLKMKARFECGRLR